MLIALQLCRIVRSLNRFPDAEWTLAISKTNHWRLIFNNLKGPDCNNSQTPSEETKNGQPVRIRWVQFSSVQHLDIVIVRIEFGSKIIFLFCHFLGKVVFLQFSSIQFSSASGYRHRPDRIWKQNNFSFLPLSWQGCFSSV
jgi:hypothetical protein